MNVIVSGGGTGGHIYPAIAIADKVMEMDANSKVLFIGNPIGLEAELVPRTGYDFKMVTARWFDRSNPLDAVKMVFAVKKGTREALKIMKEFKPDIVIGTGGYACVPVVRAGKKYGAKTFIQEQNAYPGMANKTLGMIVDNIFLGFEAGRKYFKKQEKCVFTGNPVRKDFFQRDKKQCRAELGFREDDFIVFSFGGSQGSQAINEVSYQLMKKINGQSDMSMIFGTGNQYYENIMADIKAEKLELQDNIVIKDYMNDIDKYMACADLVIGRSGALSVAETCALGKAAIYIPSPMVTGNHQFYNAKAVGDKGGAMVIEEKDLSSELIINTVFDLKASPTKLQEMSVASRNALPDNATEIIYSYFKK
ncbi:MAG: undecaprenyldiphospho-muramoylpentapeptide beta-N-acetylglucosaminyltransferase [Clostridia bacterium]|nr:undecaprenyldiphospho-muramoylpentapeptide beta-N-acetylglucosaminyltransferase [Clostridia bacterium]